MFTCGVIPFTKRPEQLAFRYVDALARGAASHSQKHGWSDLERSLREHRTALTPYLAQEGKDMSRTFLFDLDSAVVDLESIRRASEMFDEARIAHQQVMTCYRQFKEAEKRG